jgi:hypothetical protein
MADSLLTISNVNLFGLLMEDVAIVDADQPWKVRLASLEGENITPLSGQTPIDGVAPNTGDFVLIWNQATPTENGVYRVPKAGGNWIKIPIENRDFVVTSADGKSEKQDYMKWRFEAPNTFKPHNERRNIARRRRGRNRQLEEQLTADAKFARIYGFSYEGTFYDLPRPVIFLVHADGQFAADNKAGSGPRPARAPRETNLTGLAAAGFDFADELKVWSYDQADYTIRMDVETGMFEDVLLAAMLGGGPGGMEAAGMSARGMSARGMSARGMSARGMSARGMSARGGGGNGD